MSAKWFARPDRSIFQVVDITDRFAEYGDFTEVPEPPTGGRDIWDAETQEYTAYVPVLPLEDRVKAAFSALDINLQIKFAAEIMQAAFFFERDNLPMVAVVMMGAEQRLSLPDDQPVKDIIDAAKAELGG